MPLGYGCTIFFNDSSNWSVSSVLPLLGLQQSLCGNQTKISAKVYNYVKIAKYRQWFANSCRCELEFDFRFIMRMSGFVPRRTVCRFFS